MPILEVKDFSFSYAGTHSNVLKKINFTVNEGELVLLCGDTGCGKSTLLNCIKKETAPAGTSSGSILFDGKDINDISALKSAQLIGLVRQSCDGQIVTDSVYGELAFGPENLGLPGEVIRRRIAEISSYLGLGEWFNRSVDKLSGGQKQLLNIASVLILRPKLLLLDEPTSQLDPVAAGELLQFVQRLCRENGLSVILCEQRLEECFALCDKTIYMKDGSVVLCDDSRVICQSFDENDEFFEALPCAAKIFRKTYGKGPVPMTIREGRDYIKNSGLFADRTDTLENPSAKQEKAASLKIKELCFSYGKRLPDVVKSLNAVFFPGELTCIMGENGCGKTTLLKLISKILKPDSGRITFTGKGLKTALLPQDVKAMFCHSTLLEELRECAANEGWENADTAAKNALEEYGLIHLAKRHPYDLSGGEMQRAALAKLSLTNPDIYLLDEPTKGLDIKSKKMTAKMLKGLCDCGKTVIFVSHDVEFAAQYADRCMMMFDGNIVTDGPSRKFFTDNLFYTTSTGKITAGSAFNAITYEDVMRFVTT